MDIREAITHQDLDDMYYSKITGIDKIPPWELGVGSAYDDPDRILFADRQAKHLHESNDSYNVIFRLISESRMHKYDMKRVLLEQLMLSCASDKRIYYHSTVKTFIPFRRQKWAECDDMEGFYLLEGAMISTSVSKENTLLSVPRGTDENLSLYNCITSENEDQDLNRLLKLCANDITMGKDFGDAILELPFVVTFDRKDEYDGFYDCHIFDYIAKKLGYGDDLDWFAQIFTIRCEKISISPDIDYSCVFIKDDLNANVYVSMIPQWYSNDKITYKTKCMLNRDELKYSDVVEENKIREVNPSRIEPWFRQDVENGFPHNSVIYKLMPDKLNSLLEARKSKDTQNGGTEYIKDGDNTERDTNSVGFNDTPKALSFGVDEPREEQEYITTDNRNYFTIPDRIGKYISNAGGCFPVLSKLGVMDYNFIFTPDILKDSNELYDLLLLLLKSYVDTIYDKWLVSSGDTSYIQKDRLPNGIIILQDIKNTDNLKITDNNSYLVNCVKISLSYSIEDENGNTAEYSNFYQSIHENTSEDGSIAINRLHTLVVLDKISSWDKLLLKSNEIQDNVNSDVQNNISSLDLVVGLDDSKLQIVKYSCSITDDNPVFNIPMSNLINPLIKALNSSTGFTVHPSEYFDSNNTTETLHVKYYLLPSVIEIPKESIIFE